MTEALPPPIDWREAGIGPGPGAPVERRVTRDNWRTWPFTRWSFQHARELVPSRALPRGDCDPLPEHPRDLDGLTFDDGEGRAIGWDAFLERSYTDGLIVLHHGAIVFETYANGMTAATPHMGFSITKSVVGLVAETMIANGDLDPDAQVGAHLPALADSAFAAVTVRQLLDMTDGVDFDENYADPGAQVHLYSRAYWNPAAGHAGMLGVLPTMQERFAEPGTAFRYRTPVADVLGLMLRSIAGVPLSELVARHVWRPAGCCDEAYMLLDTSGVEMAGTGLNCTLRDLGRIGLWLLREDRLRATIAAGGDRALFAAGPQADLRPDSSYRSFWWVEHGAHPTIAANGVFGQRLWIDPDAELVVARFGTHPVAGNSFTELLHRNAFAALREVLS